MPRGIYQVIVTGTPHGTLVSVQVSSSIAYHHTMHRETRERRLYQESIDSYTVLSILRHVLRVVLASFFES